MVGTVCSQAEGIAGRLGHSNRHPLRDILSAFIRVRTIRRTAEHRTDRCLLGTRSLRYCAALYGRYGQLLASLLPGRY